MRELTIRFTIRDLFWLIVVVALAVGWWSQQSRLQKEHERLRTQMVELQEKANDLDQRRESVKNLMENLQNRPAK